MTKELKQIFNSIEKWMKANDNNVAFIGSFVAFDDKKIEKNEEDIIKEGRVLSYGYKETVQIMNDELTKLLRKEKNDFINW